MLKLSNNERRERPRGRDRQRRALPAARRRRTSTAFEGASVHYWASPLEAKLCAGQEVALVGAGNSAGQAAVYLASQVAKVWLLVRGADLAASMSRYLVDRIEGLANVEVVTHAKSPASKGRDGMLEAIRWRGARVRRGSRRPMRHLFLFIGAEPNTDWLAGSGVALDRKGFVLTGADTESQAAGDQPAGRVRDRRRSRRLDQARRRVGRRRRAGRGDAACHSGGHRNGGLISYGPDFDNQ